MNRNKMTVRDGMRAVYGNLIDEYRGLYDIKGHPDTLEYDQMWREIDMSMTVAMRGDWWKGVRF